VGGAHYGAGAHERISSISTQENYMNRIFASLAIVGLVTLAVPALADDVVSSAGKAQQSKVMQECMTKQAESHAQMSKEDLRQICQQQMQAQKDSNDKTSGAPPK
jgi:hypothetical protein